MYDRAIYDWVEMEYALLADGTTLSGQNCPICKGGRGGLNTFSVSRLNGQLLWFCHRASCGFRKGSSYDGFLPVAGKQEEEQRVVTYPSVFPLTDEQYKKLEENYHLSRVSINRASMGVINGYNRDFYYYMPVFSSSGTQVGYASKAMEKGTIPKAILKTVLPSACAWYPNTTKTKSILVVEDQLSAIRASEFITSVALLGTNLNEKRIDELLEVNPPFIYLALDADAFAKSVAYVAKFRARTNGKIKLLKLREDVKNMSKEAFDKLIEDCK